MSVFIGIDGGGTRSTLLAIDETGAPLARLEGGPAIVDPADPAKRAEPLGELVSAALQRLGGTGPADGLCCALAGVGRPAERATLGAALAARGLASHVHVIADAEAALQDAFGDGAGILAISGTGSAIWARGETGRMLRVGGWGLVLGDEGSGYAIGLGGLKAVLRSHDGRIPPTALTEAVLRTLELKSPDDLVRWTAMASKREVAATAPLVLDAVSHDEAARAIVARSATEMAEQIATAARLLEPWSGRVPLALSGGLISPGRAFRGPVLHALEQMAGSYRVHQDVVDAARGAALIARGRHRI